MLDRGLGYVRPRFAHRFEDPYRDDGVAHLMVAAKSQRDRTVRADGRRQAQRG